MKGPRTINFWLAGTASAPDTRLLERLKNLVERFDEVEATAKAFLIAQELTSYCVDEVLPSTNPGDLSFYAMDLLWPDQPLSFAIEFTMHGDKEGIWRVEFENDQPRYLGRDD